MQSLSVAESVDAKVVKIFDMTMEFPKYTRILTFPPLLSEDFAFIGVDNSVYLVGDFVA